MIPVCILCARAYYVLFEWEQYKDNLLSVFQINKSIIRTRWFNEYPQ